MAARAGRPPLDREVTWEAPLDGGVGGAVSRCSGPLENCYQNCYRRPSAHPHPPTRRARHPRHRRSRALLPAEDGGFEPPRVLPQHAFQVAWRGLGRV